MNSGRIIYQKLRLVYKNRYNPDGTRKVYLDKDGNEVTKLNTIFDADYIAPVEDGCECPAVGVPCGEDTSTTETTTFIPCGQVLDVDLNCSNPTQATVTFIFSADVVLVRDFIIIKDNVVIQEINNIPTEPGTYFPINGPSVPASTVTVPISKTLLVNLSIHVEYLREGQISPCGFTRHGLNCDQDTTTSTTSSSTTSTSTTSTSTTITSTTTTPPTTTETTTGQQNSLEFNLDPVSCSVPDTGISLEFEALPSVCDLVLTTTTSQPTTTTPPTTSTTSTSSSTTSSSTTTVACNKEGSSFIGKLAGEVSGSPISPYSTAEDANLGRCANSGTSADAYIYPTITNGAKIYQTNSSGDCSTFPAGHYYIQNSVGEATVYIVELNGSGTIVGLVGSTCPDPGTTTSNCKSGGLNVIIKGKQGSNFSSFDSFSEAQTADCAGLPTTLVEGVLVGGLNSGSTLYKDRDFNSCEGIPVGFYFLQDSGGNSMGAVLLIGSNGNVTAVMPYVCPGATTTTSTSTSTTSSTTTIGSPCDSGLSIEWRGEAINGDPFATRGEAELAACEGEMGCSGRISALAVGNKIYTRKDTLCGTGPCRVLYAGWYWLYPTGDIDNSFVGRIDSAGTLVELHSYPCGIVSTSTTAPPVPVVCSIIGTKDNKLYSYEEESITYIRDNVAGASSYISMTIIGTKLYARISGTPHVDEYNITSGGLVYVTRHNNVLGTVVTGLFMALGTNILFVDQHLNGVDSTAYIINPSTWTKTSISLTLPNSAATGYGGVVLDNGVLIGYVNNSNGDMKLRLINKTTYATIREIDFQKTDNSKFDEAYQLFTEGDEIFVLTTTGKLYQINLTTLKADYVTQIPTNQTTWPYEFWYSITSMQDCDSIVFPEV